MGGYCHFCWLFSLFFFTCRPPAAGSSGGKLEDLFSRGNEYSSLEDIRESSDDESEEKHSLLRPAAAEPDKEEEEEDFDKDEDEDDLDPDAFVPPDGGYGWMVAAGAFLALFWSAGLVKSYGVIFDEILAAFRGASKSLASWIPAAMVSTALAVAPVTSALCQRLDCRRVTLAGSVLCFCGMALSSLAPTLPLLFCSMGLLTGVGLGLSTTPGVILTARYFTSNRAKANAFCLSGTAAGSFALPFLIEALMSSYGFRGAVLVLSACMGHIAVSAALYRPLRVHAAIANKERRRRIRMEREEDRKSLQSSPQKMALLKADEDAVSVSSSKTGSLVLHHHGQQHRFGSQRSSDGVGGIADPLLLRTRLDLLIDRGSESPISGVSSSWNGDGEGSSSRFHHQLLHHQHHQHRHQPQHIHRHLQHQCSSPARFGGSHRSSTGSGDRKTPGVGGVWHVGQHHPHAASSSGGFSPPHSSCPFHGSSNLSLASQENLINCLEGGGGDNSPLPHLNELRYHYPEQQHRQDNVASDSHLAFAPTFSSRVQPAKALSMRDITLHQLSARFSLYKAYLVGNDGAKEKAGNNSGKSSRCGSEVNGSTAAGRTSSKKGSKSRHTSRCSNRSFGRKSSAGNSAAGSIVNLSKQQEQEHRTGGTVRQAGFRRQFSRRSSRASSSLMFSLEDLATDSTSILKDARAASSLKASSRRRKRQHQQHPPPPNSRVDVHHPAISANNSSSNLRSYDRQVSLDRDHVSRARAARKARRTRYYSEGNGAHATEISPPPFRELPQSPPSSSQVSQQAAPPPSRFTVRSSSDDLDKEEGEHKREKSPTNEVTIKDEKGRSCCSSAKSVFLKYIDLSLCREPVFLLLTASVMCMSLGVPHFLIFLPSFARQLEEGREADPALLLSVSSALDLLGRVGAGLALDAGIVPGHLLYSAAMIAAGVSAAAMPLLSAAAVSPAPLPGMMAASAAYGLGSGVWFLMVPLLLAEHLGVERIASSYGLIRFFQSGANLVRKGTKLIFSFPHEKCTVLFVLISPDRSHPWRLPVGVHRRPPHDLPPDGVHDGGRGCLPAAAAPGH